MFRSTAPTIHADDPALLDSMHAAHKLCMTRPDSGHMQPTCMQPTLTCTARQPSRFTNVRPDHRSGGTHPRSGVALFLPAAAHVRVLILIFILGAVPSTRHTPSPSSTDIITVPQHHQHCRSVRLVLCVLRVLW